MSDVELGVDHNGLPVTKSDADYRLARLREDQCRVVICQYSKPIPSATNTVLPVSNTSASPVGAATETTSFVVNTANLKKTLDEAVQNAKIIVGVEEIAEVEMAYSDDSNDGDED